MSKFLNSLKLYDMLGLRVALSIALVFLITYSFDLERSYWAVITIISVNISINFADILARSWLRLIASIIGLLSGTLLYYYFLVNIDINLIYLLLLICTTLAIYFVFISYPVAMFFNSIFVVFIFASIHCWSTHLLIVRLYETLLGSAISLLVAYIFMTKNSIKYIFDDLETLNRDIRSFLNSFEKRYDERFVAFQKFHLSEQNILDAMSNSKFDYTNQEFYSQTKDVLQLLDELPFDYQKWYELWNRIRVKTDNKDHEVMYENIVSMLESEELATIKKLQEPEVKLEKLLNIYYVTLFDKIDRINNSLRELKTLHP